MTHVETLFDHDVKIKTLILYQGDELHHDDIEDLIGVYDDEALAEILSEDLCEVEDDKVYDIFDAEYTGYFFAEVHTPVRKPFGKRGTLSWSWGTTTFTLIIAKTIEELVELSCKWADDKAEEFRKGFEKEMADEEKV